MSCDHLGFHALATRIMWTLARTDFDMSPSRNQMRRCGLVVILFSIAALANAENWPSFRGPNASGVADGKPTPTSWDASKGTNILWKTPIPGLAHSSPVVWGDRVFVTTAVSSKGNENFRHGLFGDVTSDTDLSKHSWHVYCLDKRTGRIIWDQIASEGVPKVKRHIKSSHASSTPATDGRNVVAFFGSEGLFCYDVNGKLQWKKDLGVLDAGWFYDPGYQWETASSPTIYEGPSRVELITNATRAVRGYEPATGKELWRLSGNPEVTATTPIAAQGLIFICNSYSPNQPIYAIKAGANGDISLKKDETSNQYVAWSMQRGGTYMPTPIVYGEYLYTCANHGIIACYNFKTGERLYQQRIGENTGSYSASPVAANGKIYLSSEDGDIFVVKAGPKYELIATNPMGEVLMATPAISDGMIFVRGQHSVFAIGEPGAASTATKN